jgi:hypothetical protein
VLNDCLTADNGGCQQTCVPFGNISYCLCKPGFHLIQTDNFCAAQPWCSWVSDAGGLICYCPINNGQSFQYMNGSQCNDTNECLKYNGGCEQECQNSYGSYKCCCGAGYTLSANNHNCEDINECLSKTACADNAVCINTLGDYMCVYGATEAKLVGDDNNSTSIFYLAQSLKLSICAGVALLANTVNVILIGVNCFFIGRRGYKSRQ